MIITEREHLIKQKDINNFFHYLVYVYGLGFTIFMMYVSYRSMNIIENAVNKLDSFECEFNLILHNLELNTSICKNN